MSQVKAVNVEISVVLGRSTLPMQQLLRMGRGAVIPLDAKASDEVWILANNHPVARGVGKRRRRGARVSQVKAVNVEISVVLGRSTLPMQQLLRMGRGAVIPLDAKASDEVWILANNHPVARGEIQINDEKISIAVTRAANLYDYIAGGI